MKRINRRQALKGAGVGIAGLSTAGLAGCLGGQSEGGSSESSTTGSGSSGDSMYEGGYTLGEDSIDLVAFQLGLEQGIWDEYGFDFEIQISAYPEWARSLTTGGMDFGGCDQMMFLNAHRDDHELVFLGSNQMQINAIFVRPDSDIEGPEDLVDRSVGVPPWASATTTSAQGIFLDEYDIDLREDVDSTASDPPVLWELLQDGEIDAMLQFSGQTVRGYANPDQVRPIFDFNEYWEERTGHTLQVVPFAARKEWLEDNYDIAYEFIQAHQAALDALSENPSDVYSRYGALAGLTSEEEVEAVADLFEDGRIHPLDKSIWDEGYLRAQWELLDLMGNTENVDSVPDREEYSVTYDELTDLASE